MRYERIAEGKFIERPNRFVAKVEIDGKTETVHVKNTGRCRELLQTGATVYLEDFQGRMGSRKMRYSLVAVDKVTDRGIMTVNMDSQAPNKVAHEALKEGRIPLEGMGNLTLIRPETKYGDSRFDFYLEDDLGNRAFVEVKGVTLEYDGHASFPDAPTERGARHVRELASALKEGYKAYILFVIQMKPIYDIRPNEEHDPVFSEELRKAVSEGVRAVAVDCLVTPDSLRTDEEVKVII
jgi:sugar fermentation stimulation protein A